MFCSACGAARSSSFCTACGAAAGSGVRYCAPCGAPLAEGAPACAICGAPRSVSPPWPPSAPSPRFSRPLPAPTPAPHVPYAGVARRALATVIDLAPIGLLYIGMAALFGDLDAGEEAAALSATHPAFLLWLAMVAAYYLVMEARWGGTAGKLVAGLRVARRDGRPASWREVVLRTLLRPVDAIGLYLVAAVCVWSTTARQRLGDRAAGTVVLPRLRR